MYIKYLIKRTTEIEIYKLSCSILILYKSNSSPWSFNYIFRLQLRKGYTYSV